MSINTLYLSFKGSVDTSEDIDILASEVGTTVTRNLDPLDPVKTALGDDWKVSGARIPQKSVSMERRRRTCRVFRPRQMWAFHKRAFSGTIKTYTHTRPARIVTRTITYHVPTINFFQLDGRIGDNARFFAHFWNDSGTLKFYMVFAFGNGAIEDTFFHTAYWPERASHSFSRPRVLVFSHPHPAVFGRDWPAGAFLLMEVEYGSRLKAAASGTETPMRFGGPIGVVRDQFTFDLVSWPTRNLTFDGGRVVIENVQLFAKTADWDDGDPPRIIEDDDEDEVADRDEEGDEDRDEEGDIEIRQSDLPDPHDVQFNLLGSLKVTESVKLAVWTPLARDSGIAVWRTGRIGEKLARATLFNSFLGDQAWLGIFGGDLKNYVLEDFELVVDQPGRKLAYASYVLKGKLLLKRIGPDVLELPGADISCTITDPGGDSRQELIEAAGQTMAYGTLFEVHVDFANSLATLTSADGQGFDKWSQSFWYKERRELAGFEDSDIEGTYERIHILVDMGRKGFWVWASNEAGDSRKV